MHFDPATDKVRVTDQKDDGWRQVMRKGETYWVNADYLSKSKPKAPSSSSSSRRDWALR